MLVARLHGICISTLCDLGFRLFPSGASQIWTLGGLVCRLLSLWKGQTLGVLRQRRGITDYIYIFVFSVIYAQTNQYQMMFNKKTSSRSFRQA